MSESLHTLADLAAQLGNVSTRTARRHLAAALAEARKKDTRCWQWCDCEAGCRAAEPFEEIAAPIRARAAGGAA